MRSFFYLFLFFSILILGCYNDECRYIEPSTVANGQIILDFKDRLTGDYLIGKTASKYLKADISITDAEGMPVAYDYLDILSSNGHYQIDFRDFHSEAIRDKDICKRFFINFKLDQDTLDLCFNIKTGKCGGTYYDYFTTKFNGEVVEKMDYNTYYIRK